MSQGQADQTYYEILEVNRDAPHHEIVKAYQRAKETYSPDSPALYSMFTKDEAEELRILIEEAYQVLGNQAKRREYDEQLLGERGSKDELPDFPPPRMDAVLEMRTERGSEPLDKNAPLPDGFKRSKLSIYEVKQDVEDEIENCTEFDGAFLRKIRLYKNINIDQMSKETRIGRSYIAAIESSDFDGLPAPVFVRGFIIQIARILGLDENAAASSYMSTFHQEE
jgi:curved DNA-binding protein CbpA